MACPLCGDECRCSYVPSRPVAEAISFSSQPEHPPILIDPEPYDYSEEQFAASILHDEEPVTVGGGDDEPAWSLVSATAAQKVARARASRPEPPAAMTTDQWRQEVSSRVDKYRARRGRPRPEPSLRFNFDFTDHLESAPAPVQMEAAVPDLSGFTAEAPPLAPPPDLSGFQPTAPAKTELPVHALGIEGPYSEEDEAVAAIAEAEPWSAPEPQPAAPEPETAKIIEFPRPAVITPPSQEELAEPILDVPRILEAPEAVATETPLADITLSQEVDEAIAALFDLPLQPAPMEQRVFAGLVDTILVLMSTAVFVLIASRMSAAVPDGKAGVALLLALPCVLWAIYQYIFLVYSGGTPGMQAAHLTLANFEGLPVPRSLRRWRAVAIMLAAFSLGLGILWALLDEDTLCWHDRITKTYPVRSS